MKFTCQGCGKDLEGTDVLDHVCQIGAPVNVPDVAGEVTGWRAWHIIPTAQGPRLRSLTRDLLWQPKRFLIASCKDHGVEQIPAEKCRCGFYAAKSRDHLIEMKYNRYGTHSVDADPVAVGTVAMSGRIIPGTQGYRAQKVRPTYIQVPFEHWRLLNPLLETYGIDGELANVLVPDLKEVNT